MRSSIFKPSKSVAAVAGLATVAIAVVVAVVVISGNEPVEVNLDVLAKKNGCEQGALSLPEGAGKDSQKSADVVSPSGEYVVGDAGYGPMMWTNGKPEKLSDITGPYVGVTSYGEISSHEGQLNDDGNFTEVADDEDVELAAVNDSGLSVGYRTRVAGEASGLYSVPTVPVTWQDGEVWELDLEPGMRGGALSITEDGSILGFQAQKDSDETEAGVPWMWTPDGGSHELPSPSDDPGAFAVDVAGDWVLTQVDGPAAYPGSTAGGYRWNLSNPDEFEELDDRLYHAGIDDSGRVYGTVDGEPGFLDSDGEIVALPDKNGGVVLNDVSADGSTMVGYDNNHPTVRDAPLMWICDH